MFYKGSSPMLSVPKLNLNNVSLQSVITWQNNNQKPYWGGRPRAEMKGVAYSSSFMWSSARIQSPVKYPLTRLLASTLTQTHTAHNLTAPCAPSVPEEKGCLSQLTSPSQRLQQRGSWGRRGATAQHDTYQLTWRGWRHESSIETSPLRSVRKHKLFLLSVLLQLF